MRKLKLQVQVSIDGFIAGPGGAMDWMTHPWDDALNAYVDAVTEPVDTIVLGRRLAEGFIPNWAAVADAGGPEAASGRFFTDTPKVIFSRRLDRSPWPNATLANGDLAEAIGRLKQAEGGDLIAYGGAELASSLVQHGLIDEFHLFVNPVALGGGLPIFGELAEPRRLVLEEARPFACGIVALCYRRAD